MPFGIGIFTAKFVIFYVNRVMDGVTPTVTLYQAKNSKLFTNWCIVLHKLHSLSSTCVTPFMNAPFNVPLTVLPKKVKNSQQLLLLENCTRNSALAKILFSIFNLTKLCILAFEFKTKIFSNFVVNKNLTKNLMKFWKTKDALKHVQVKSSLTTFWRETNKLMTWTTTVGKKFQDSGLELKHLGQISKSKSKSMIFSNKSKNKLIHNNSFK